MAANRAAVVLSPAGLAFRNDLNQTGKQVGLKNAAISWTLLRDLMAATGWTPGPFRHSPRHRVILLSGEKRSASGPILNPAFCDWMMGWPPGWTDPLRSVTGWSRWLQQGRGLC